MRIPEIRQEMLREAARCPDLFLQQKLKEWESQLYRRPYVRKAPVSARPITDQLVKDVRAYAADNPRASYLKIGARFGINTGRVSEILAGKRS